MRYPIGARLSDGRLRSLTGERFALQSKGHGPKAAPLGAQGLDLYPGLKAILVQVGWRF